MLRKLSTMLIVTWGFIGSGLSAPGVPYPQNDQPLRIEVIAGDLVKARTEVYNRVISLKQSKYGADKNSAEFKLARRNYEKAQEAYSGWIGTLHFAIERNMVKDLRTNGDYKDKTAAAAQAARTFVTYVDSKTDASMGLFAFASDAATIGIKIWNAVRTQHDAERQAFVKDFDSYVKWDNWDSVGTSPDKPAASTDEKSEKKK